MVKPQSRLFTVYCRSASYIPLAYNSSAHYAFTSPILNFMKDSGTDHIYYIYYTK